MQFPDWLQAVSESAKGKVNDSYLLGSVFRKMFLLKMDSGQGHRS